MSYSGTSKAFLESAGISIGDSVRVYKKDITYEGMILDRSEDADDKHIVLKLNNGYNIGLDIRDADIEFIAKGEKPKIELKHLDVEKDTSKHNISILSTG
ncbi:MAG: Glu-tRNA(Gln) amidotransferase subunit GatD, partial [Methanobacterium sp.]